MTRTHARPLTAEHGANQRHSRTANTIADRTPIAKRLLTTPCEPHDIENAPLAPSKFYRQQVKINHLLIHPDGEPPTEKPSLYK